MTITPTAEATGAAKPALSKGHLVALKPPRLPYHEAVAERFGIDRAGWKALVEAIYPNAETADAIVMALSYCRARNLDPFKRPVHIYRWPYGLLNRRAWKFSEPRPLLEELSARPFYMDAALGLVELIGLEATAIEKLPPEEVELLAPTKAYARVHGDDAARRRGAPPPTTTRRGVMHLRAAPAYTYLMQIEGAAEEAYGI